MNMNFFSNGDNNFYWFMGVVEDRNDPMKLGRCRVRILGYHTDDIELLPTEDLPWAVPILPVYSASTSGIGRSPTGVVEGTWVFGFFLDGNEGQQPAMLGTLIAEPKKKAKCPGSSEESSGRSPSSDGSDGSSESPEDGGGGSDQRNDIQNARDVSPNQEFWTLVAICSREASAPAENWTDVAQSILNRALSGRYSGKTVTSNITKDGQYEPCWKFPRKGTANKTNPDWRKIKDLRSAMRATGNTEAFLLEVARALKNTTLQNNSRSFIGPRTDFLGYDQPMLKAAENKRYPIRCRDPKGESSNPSVRKTARKNKFGFSYNYKGDAGVANIPDWIRNADIGN